jgi:pyruvate/2-oxoglutarate dehydrogenase complex dihydrolipoamide dehydrogenase (E3) component
MLELDEALSRRVRPSDWMNPAPAARYNLVVLGAGTAGLVAAAGGAGLGAKVALIERDAMGGDCLNVGCVPSKALLRSARAAGDARAAGTFGVRAGEVSVDFAAVMERMRGLRAGLSPTDSAERFRSLGVDVFFGAGRFAGPDTVEAGGRTLRFDRALIATGARPAVPAIAGLREAGFLTNETVFNLKELPRRLAVIGAGPIGCELAQAFRRLGSEVLLLGRAGRVLPRDDEQASAIVQAAFEREGIRFEPEASVTGATRSGSERRLTWAAGGRTGSAAVDEILVAAGRAPNLEGLGLELARVAFDARRGVAVDDHLRTTNPRVFAAGDVCLSTKFTHMSDATARLALQNALFMGRARLSSLVVPWCTYTDPEVAHVGLTEKEAEEKGIAIRTFTQPLEHVDRAVLDGETEGFAKVHVRAGSDEIVGATVVARHAGDLISELTLAIASGAGLKRLASTIHPYPTQAEALKKLGDAFNRTRLTPRVKRLLEAWLAWRRR